MFLLFVVSCAVIMYGSLKCGPQVWMHDCDVGRWARTAGTEQPLSARTIAVPLFRGGGFIAERELSLAHPRQDTREVIQKEGGDTKNIRHDV